MGKLILVPLGIRVSTADQDGGPAQDRRARDLRGEQELLAAGELFDRGDQPHQERIDGDGGRWRPVGAPTDCVPWGAARWSHP